MTALSGHRPARSGPSAARGFTLVEVLIGVLVMALGLLGLGAIIPVIVREQRIASDATLGVTAASDARALFDARPDFNPQNTGAGTVPVTAWNLWLDDQRWSPLSGPGAFEFEPWGPELLPDGTLEFAIASTGGSPAFRARLTVADRLWPVGSRKPAFVWDMVARRLPGEAAATPWPSPEMQQLQVAVFVRRLDQNIRVPAGSTLFDVVTANAGINSRFPVAVDPSSGLPTNNGLGAYAQPIVTRASIGFISPGNVRDRLVISGTQNEIDLASATGQKLVDNLGNVYTVRGVPETPSQAGEVVIEPPVPPSVDPANAGNVLTQVVFTPQVPAAVRVFTVTRPAK
jgi:prepilin-type N-terminal cleavage/methylation domain-containing protein